MKARLHILFILLVIGWSSCTRHTTYPLFMQEAAMCMNEHPDHALELLQHQKDSIASFPEETQMYYHLLCIQARDKQYIEHTSDSLINQIVQYYENYDDAEKLMMAYYYQGSTYRDMNDAPRALKAFQQAVDVSNKDNELLPKVYSQMGNLFAYQGLYDESIEVNRKSMDFYLNRGEVNQISYALRDIGRMYDMKEQRDSALIFYKKACNVVLANEDTIGYYEILGESGSVYYKIGQIDSAKQILLSTLHKLNEKNCSNIYALLGYVYEKLQLWDSAYYYREKSITSGDLHRMQSGYKGLSKLEKRKGNYLKAMQYLEEAISLNDSINKVTQTEATAKINSLYNYQHTEKENFLLKVTKSKQKNLFLIIILFLILVISFGINYLFYSKRKKLQLILQERKAKQIAEEKYMQSQLAIQDNQQKIAKLDLSLEKAKQENNRLLQELYLIQKKKIELSNQNIILSIEEQELYMLTFKQSDYYEQLKAAAKDDTIIICSDNWERIKNGICSIYPNFNRHLEETFPNLSEYERQICWLAKLDFTPTEISNILKRSRQAITNVRTRLHKRVHIQDYINETFDSIIKKL